MRAAAMNLVESWPIFLTSERHGIADRLRD